MKERNDRGSIHQVLGAAYRVTNSVTMGIYGQ
jgi:hypothetical protein